MNLRTDTVSAVPASQHGALQWLEAMMRRCRRSPILNILVRRPLQLGWYGGWTMFFALRNALRGPYCELRVHGGRLFVDLRDRVIARRLYWFGVYEVDETALVRRLVRPGMTVLDVGANVGYYTMLFARLVGQDGRVVAFEPMPDNLELLTRSVQANGFANVEAVNAAAVDRPGLVSLSLSTKNFGAHRVKQDNAGNDASTLAVPATTVDAVVKSRGLKPDVVKIDVEGAEGLVLRGMAETLADNPDVLLLCEFNPEALRDSGIDAQAFVGALSDAGFRFHAIGAGARLTGLSADRLLKAVAPGRHINILAARADLSATATDRSP